MTAHSFLSASVFDLIDVAVMREDYAPCPDIAATRERDFYASLERWRIANRDAVRKAREARS